MQRVAAQPPGHACGRLGHQRDQRHAARKPPPRVLGGGVEDRCRGRWLSQEQHQQFLAAALQAPGFRRLGVRVTLHRLGGQLVDVGEDRFGELVLGLDRSSRSGGQPADPPPRHPGPHPIGGLERVEAAPGPVLAAAEGVVDAAGVRLPMPTFGQKPAQRLLDPGEDAAAERAL